MAKKSQKSVTGKDATAARPTREASWVAIDTVPSPEHPPFHQAGPDPVPSWYLLDKTDLAQLKISKLDTDIAELEKQIELCKIERDLLKKVYKLK